MRSVLNVNLSTLFSSIQFAYPVVENANIMSEDWKWVLRSAPATRPVLRYVDIDADADAARMQPGRTAQSCGVYGWTRHRVFGHTRSRECFGWRRIDERRREHASRSGRHVRFGDLALRQQPDPVQRQFRYGSANGGPATAFRTSYSREMAGGTPEVSLTIRQLMLPGRVAAAFASPDGAGLALLRTMSAGFSDAE